MQPLVRPFLDTFDPALLPRILSALVGVLNVQIIKHAVRIALKFHQIRIGQRVLQLLIFVLVLRFVLLFLVVSRTAKLLSNTKM